jgi:osmotically-inducible protein OsmY
MQRLLLTSLMFVTIFAIAACSSMLVGGGSGSAGGSATLGVDNRSATQVAADDAVSATIRSRFANDTALRAAGLQVTTSEYNVTLSGSVSAFSDRDRAVSIARNTDNVRTVNNQIAVDSRQ